MSNDVKMQLVESAQAKAPEASGNITVTDSTGRVIGIRKPPFLAQFRLAKVLGPTASNDAYMNMVSPVLYVSSIGGDPVAFPTSELQVEAILQRLDEHGYKAVYAGMKEHFTDTGEDLQEEVKNA